jgi:hypothetical protein
MLVGSHSKRWSASSGAGATVQREIVIAGSERVVATRIKITDAGRKAIE